jgi:hypothetical protein
MLSLSLKNERRQHRLPAGLHPEPADAGNFAAVFEKNNFLLYTSGTRIIVTGGATWSALLRRRAGRLRHRQGARRTKRAIADPDRAHHAGACPT